MAATLLVAAGSNPESLRSEAASPPYAGSILYLHPPARPTGTVSTAADTVRPTQLSIVSLSSDFDTIREPRPTCIVALQRE